MIVTGGSRGIGRAIVDLFAAEGADVTLFYRSDAAAADAAVAAARSAARAVAAIRVDVRDSAACRDAVESVVERCGRVDILVNNAGVIRDNPLSAFEDADVADVLDTNVTGVFNVTRAVVPHMIAKRAGRIVNLSSVSGEKGGRGQTNYAASKGAINAFTRALAVELAPRKINVNGVAPGVIETEMSAAVRELAGDEVKSRILLRRFGTPGRGRVRGVVPRIRVRELRDGAGLQCRWRLQDGVTNAQTEITKEEINAVYPTVAETIADALGCEVDGGQARRLADRGPGRGVDRLPRHGLPPRARVQGQDPARQDRRERARRALRRRSSSTRGSSPTPDWRSSRRTFPRCPPSASARRSR